MRTILRKIIRAIWPPEHTASSEEIHYWRVAVSISIMTIAATLFLHIFMAAGLAEPTYPGFVTQEDYDDQVTAWTKARLSDLRVDILKLQVDYCLAEGKLAEIYNHQLNELLVDYRALHGPDIVLPDCDDVRRGR